MMDGLSSSIKKFWRQQRMYEIRKAGNTYRIYDRENEKYVAHTQDKNLAEKYVTDILRNKGFEGDIPNFFMSGKKYGVKLLSH